VRVTAQLIDVANDRHLWSETYDRELPNIFAIQDEISLSIAEALKVELVDNDTLREVPTNNMDAYTFYLQGRKEFMVRGTDDRNTNIGNLRRAILFYEQAVSLDPNFAEAWGELATCTILLPSYGEYSIENVAPRANEAANRAISINPDLSQAWVVKGIINLSKYQFQDAQTALLRATELNPKNDTAWLWLGLHFAAVGNQDRALEAIENATQIAPEVGVNFSNLGRVLHAKGDLDQAISVMDKAISELGYENGRHDRAYMAISKNNPARAQAEMIMFFHNNYQISGDEIDYKLGIYANTYFDPSLRDEALTLLNKDIENDMYQTFFPFFMLQDGEKLIYYFESTSANKGLNLTRIYFPLNRQLFEQKIFRDYIIKIGLLTYWQNYSFPDFCHAVGTDDFSCE
jgi:tetratricopeptide (TPR) repeat protein